jgi:hypothetical protein
MGGEAREERRRRWGWSGGGGGVTGGGEIRLGGGLGEALTRACALGTMSSAKLGAKLGDLLALPVLMLYWCTH